ncbi:MFS-type transporter SLC18B1-like [Oppia nitens]|uniref:MFS-type transporter SLC18B1-like n=1 Tax=Oppia nitens TaxID=1686743 RepID=UPI0023DC8419|nr:MFS-type transporter SLC18B1-like [Oppia nitens]
MITTGLLMAGICSAIFGALQWIPSGTTFIAIAMASRTIEGLGAAAYSVSCWTTATIEMCYGVGMIFGPAIGGLLNQIQKLSSVTTGGIFVISGALYALFNQVWAYFADKMPTNCHPLCLIGCTSSLIAFLIVGPMPFFPIESKSGFPDNVSTYSVVSGIFSSAMAMGSAIGPGIGGYMLGQMGYRWATVPIVGLQLFVAKQKGANETWIGIIIAEYQIALFFGSAIFGKFIPPLTLKFMITTALLIAGICSAIFGALQWIPSGTPFIAIAMASRTIEGLGSAAFFATTEMCYSVGMIFGPAIGGLLNQIQKLSSVTTGGIFVISGALCALFNQIWAYFADKMPTNCHPLCLIGLTSSLIAFLIVGPMPFFPIES